MRRSTDPIVRALWHDLPFVAACTFFFVFVAARALHVPFTYDEAASYIRYIDASVPSVFDTNALSIFNFEVATNHLLNSLLVRASYVLGGTSEFSLRFPNLLGYALYLWFSVRIMQRVSNRLLGFAGLLLLNLNPYVLDFFALSRGYGLSLGLLLGLVFFLLRFLERAMADESRSDLWRALAFGCAAVTANFSLLNVYLSAVVVTMVALALHHRRLASSGDLSQTAVRADRNLLPVFLAAFVFIPLVFSQDVALSPALYEPMTIRLIGLDDGGVNRAKVFRLDIRGRESVLHKDDRSGTWSSAAGLHFRGLRIELPRTDSDQLTRIEAVIGDRALSHDPRAGMAWTVHDAGDTRWFDSTAMLSRPRSRIATFAPVINWTGDRAYAARLAMATACALGLLACLAILLHFVGRVTLGLRLMDRRAWHALSSSLLWVATLAGPPLYLLKRNSELYFGGTRGLVQDTFTSIVENSFYGRTYFAAQTASVFACVGAIIAVFLVLLAAAQRRNQATTLLAAGSIFAIMTMTSLSLVLQRIMFHTVYLVGRTALFYAPLFVLFFVFVCDRLAQTGRLGRVASLTCVVAAATLTGFHFARTANLRYVYDWRHDASTKKMMEDVSRLGWLESPHAAAIRLGVEPQFAPAAVYYARRTSSDIEVVVVPSTRRTDFTYASEHDTRTHDIVGRYDLTRTVLIRNQP